MMYVRLAIARDFAAILANFDKYVHIIYIKDKVRKYTMFVFGKYNN